MKLKSNHNTEKMYKMTMKATVSAAQPAYSS